LPCVWVKVMLKRFFRDERGLEGSEYALLLALICLAIIGAVVALRQQIADAFQDTADLIEANRETGDTGSST